MSSIGWESLKAPDTNLAWSICSIEMSKNFFSSDMVVVPEIQEAHYFDLLVCFSKPNPKGIMDNVKKLWKKFPDYCLHGHIADLVKKPSPDVSEPSTNVKALVTACNNTVLADVDSSQSDTWESTSDGISKKIKIKLQGMSKEVINWSQLDEGDLVFNREVLDLEGRRTLFIITEVVYAENIHIEVSVDEKTEETTLDNNKKIPIAFSYMKFPIDKYGVLKQAKDTDVKITASFDV